MGKFIGVRRNTLEGYKDEGTTSHTHTGNTTLIHIISKDCVYGRDLDLLFDFFHVVFLRLQYKTKLAQLLLPPKNKKTIRVTVATTSTWQGTLSQQPHDKNNYSKMYYFLKSVNAFLCSLCL